MLYKDWIEGKLNIKVGIPFQKEDRKYVKVTTPDNGEKTLRLCDIEKSLRVRGKKISLENNTFEVVNKTQNWVEYKCSNGHILKDKLHLYKHIKKCPICDNKNRKEKGLVLSYPVWRQQLNDIELIKISKKDKEILTGELLGDGSLVLRQSVNGEKANKDKVELGICNQNAWYSHSCKHKEHLEYLKNNLQFLNNCDILTRTYFDNRENWKVETTTNSTQSNLNKTLTQWRYLWYPDNKKIVPESIKITPRVLYHWYIGDGHKCKTRRDVGLSTCGFTLKDCLILQNKLALLNIDTTINGSEEKNSLVIRIRSKSFDQFFNILSPFKDQIECYRYKFPI